MASALVPKSAAPNPTGLIDAINHNLKAIGDEQDRVTQYASVTDEAGYQRFTTVGNANVTGRAYPRNSAAGIVYRQIKDLEKMKDQENEAKRLKGRLEVIEPGITKDNAEASKAAKKSAKDETVAKIDQTLREGPRFPAPQGTPLQPSRTSSAHRTSSAAPPPPPRPASSSNAPPSSASAAAPTAPPVASPIPAGPAGSSSESDGRVSPSLSGTPTEESASEVDIAGAFMQVDILTEAVKKSKPLSIDRADKEKRLLPIGTKRGKSISYEEASTSVLKFLLKHAFLDFFNTPKSDPKQDEVTKAVKDVAILGIGLFEKKIGRFHSEHPFLGKLPNSFDAKEYSEDLADLYSQLTKFALAIQPPLRIKREDQEEKFFLSPESIEPLEIKIRVLVGLIKGIQSNLEEQSLFHQDQQASFLHLDSYFFGTPTINKRIAILGALIEDEFKRIQDAELLFPVFIETRTKSSISDAYRRFALQIHPLFDELNEARMGGQLTTIGLKKCQRQVYGLCELLVNKIKHTNYSGVNYFERLDKEVKHEIGQMETSVEAMLKTEKERGRAATATEEKTKGI